MALSQRASEGQNFTQAMTVAAPLANLDPGVVDRNLDADRTFRGIFLANNVNPKYLRTMGEVAERRQAQEEAAQSQQELAMAEAAGRAGKDFAAMTGAMKGGGGGA